MKTLKESILDKDFDIKEDKEISMALHSVDWKHYILRIFRTDDLSVFDNLEKILNKQIEKKIPVSDAVIAVTSKNAIRELAHNKTIMLTGKDVRGYKGQINESWDFVYIFSPEHCIRIIKRYKENSEPFSVEVNVLDIENIRDWVVKKTAVKKAYVISNGLAITRAFDKFYK